MGARSKARKRALDVLYAAELRGEEPVDGPRPGDRGRRRARPTTTPPTLVRGVVAEHRARIDELLAAYSQGWTLDRMPAVDRNVLRLGVYELLYVDDVPDAVAVTEAMGLVRDLSTDESPAFVNGVLGASMRQAARTSLDARRRGGPAPGRPAWLPWVRSRTRPSRPGDEPGQRLARPRGPGRAGRLRRRPPARRLAGPPAGPRRPRAARRPARARCSSWPSSRSGGVLIWLIALGMFAAGALAAARAAVGHREEDGAKRWRKRASTSLKAVIYGVIGMQRRHAWRSASAVAAGSGTDSLTAKLMDLPGGQLLVGAGRRSRSSAYGVDLIRIGLHREVPEKIDARRRRQRRGRAGLLLVRQGRLHRQGHRDHHRRRAVRATRPSPTTPKKSGGLDRRCTRSSSSPSARSCWASSRVGLACYGLFCFARAEHLASLIRPGTTPPRTAASTCSGVVTMLGPSRR